MEKKREKERYIAQINRERERKREGEKEREKERKREREKERKREGEKESRRAGEQERRRAGEPLEDNSTGLFPASEALGVYDKPAVKL